MGRLRKEFTDLEAGEIVSLYNERISLEEIASRFNCSRTPIYALLKEKDIEIDTSRKVTFDDEDATESMHKQRFHDEKEKFPYEKYDAPGAMWLESKLKALGHAQSMINRVFSFYINNWERYTNEQELTISMLKACRIREEVASFLAFELNAYMFPKPGERLAMP